MSSLPKYLIRLTFASFFLLTIVVKAHAQTDQIEGLWYNDIKSAKILITRNHDGKFSGKIDWLKDPLENGKPKLDNKNSNENLRNKPILGLYLLKDFVKDGDNKYTGGTIYDPKNGKTYSCKMTYKGNSLDIRGYVGISLLGRTTTWTKAQ